MNKTTILWALFALQAVCSGYFLLDLALDFLAPNTVNPIADSDLLEGLVTLALVLGLEFTGNELRLLQSRHDHLNDQIRVASGAFSDVLETRFAEWDLTAAEREVAIFAIKGFSIAEIAQLRNTREGTAKAQCAALYRKAGVAGRLQLISIFLDDIVSDDLIANGVSAPA